MGHALQPISPPSVQLSHQCWGSGSIKAVKYLFKYIYKGHDQVYVAVREADQKDSEGNIDEIKQYRDAR